MEQQFNSSSGPNLTWHGPGANLENTLLKLSSAAWRRPLFFRHRPFSRWIRQRSSAEYSFAAEERKQTHRCVAWSHFTHSHILGWEWFVLACVVWGKSYYRETLAGCAPPPSKSPSCLLSARVVCWSYWNRSTCTSSPAIKQGLLCDGSESNILPAAWRFCVCVKLYQHWHR